MTKKLLYFVIRRYSCANNKNFFFLFLLNREWFYFILIFIYLAASDLSCDAQAFLAAALGLQGAWVSRCSAQAYLPQGMWDLSPQVPWPGMNPCLLHWKVDSQPLDRPGTSPRTDFNLCNLGSQGYFPLGKSEITETNSGDIFNVVNLIKLVLVS